MYVCDSEARCEMTYTVSTIGMFRCRVYERVDHIHDDKRVDHS